MNKILKPLYLMANIMIVMTVLISWSPVRDQAEALYSKVWTTSAFTGEGTEASPLDLARGTELVPAQITADQDNFNPTGWDDATRVTLEGDGKLNAITSFAAPVAATSPQEKTLFIEGSFAMYIPGGHLSGTAANRVITDGRDFFLFPGRVYSLIYDNTEARWRIAGDPNPWNWKSSFYSHSAGSSTTADWGDITLTSSGTASAITTVSAVTGFPIYWQMATGTQATGFGGIFHSKGMVDTYMTGDGHITASALWWVPAVSDGTETFTVALQITGGNGTSSSITANNTVGIRYTHGTNSGKLEGYSIDNAAGVATTDLGVTVAINTIYSTTVEIDKNLGEVRFYVNGLPAGTPITTNIPSATGVVPRIAILKSAGTTARNLNVVKLWSSIVYPQS